MEYDSFAKNKKILDKLYGRKVFKKHCFHLDNTEGFHWDNYDIYYYYNDENDNYYSPAFKPNQSEKTTQTPPSINIRKHSSVLNPDRFKTHKHFTSSTTNQIHPQTADASTQDTTHFTNASTQASKHFTNASTQITKHFTNTSTQTNPVKENKFSLFKFFLFIINNFY